MNNRWSIPADYYIRVFDEVIDKKILDSVNKELMSLDTIKEIDDPYSIPAVSETHWEPHRWYHPKTGEFNIREKELESTKKIVKHHKKIINILHNCLSEYMRKIGDKHFTGWAGFTQPLYHRYFEGTDMAAHVDHITSIFDDRKGVPILSMVIQLNDGYEGGQFNILGKDIPMNAGSVLIFPSNFLFEHEVKNITKGMRLSAICWAY